MICKLTKKNILRAKLHHLWSTILLIVAIVVVSTAILLTLIRASTPLLAKHHEEIQNWLSHRLKHPITIGSLKVGWQKFDPIIKISNVTIKSNSDRSLIHIGNFSIGFNILKTILSRHLNIGLLNLANTQLTIQQHTNGNLLILGEDSQIIARITNNKQSKGKKGSLLKELFSVDRIHLSDLNIKWQRPDERVIKFKNVQLQMNNQNKHHLLWGTAEFEQSNNGNMSFVADLNGNIMNKATLNGNIFIQGQQLNLTKWIPLCLGKPKEEAVLKSSPFRQKRELKNEAFLSRFSAENFNSIKLMQGFITGKSWLTLTAGKLTNIQSSFQIHNVIIKNINTSHFLKLNQIKANINWKKLNAGGWRLTGNHFFIANYLTRPAKFYVQTITQRQTWKITVHLSYLPITLIHTIATLTQLKNAQQFFLKNNLNGMIENIYGTYSNPKKYAWKFAVKNLAIENLSQAVSFKSLNANVFIFPTMGEIQIKSHHFIFTNALLKKARINFKPFDNTIYWYKNSKQFTVYSPQLTLANSAIGLHGEIQLFIPVDDLKNTEINMNFNSTAFKLNQLNSYLPKKSDSYQHLFRFLREAFKKGTAQAEIKFNGTVGDFIRVIQGREKSPKFLAIMHLKNVDLHYKLGWPDLQNINGNLYLLNNQMTVQAHSATMYNSQLQNITAIIPNIADTIAPKIAMTADINGTLENTKKFIENTPLKNKLGKKIKDINFSGPMTLNLKLDVPLKHNTFKTQVQGVLRMENAKINLPHLNINFYKVNGNLNFDNHSILSKNITGFLFNNPVNVNIQTIHSESNQSIIQFDCNGRFNVEDLKKHFLNKFIIPLSGTSYYTAQLKLYSHITEKPNKLKIISNLIGVNSQLPYPFDKREKQAEDFSGQLTFDDSKPIEIGATLGKKISFQGQFKKNDNIFSFYSGNLSFGKSHAIQQTQPGLLIDGHLSKFNWTNWKNYFFDKLNTSQKNNFLRLINLKLTEADVYNYLFIRTHIQATKENDSWKLLVDGPDISGRIVFPSKKIDFINANLKRLYLDKDNLIANKQKSTISPVSFPGFDISIDDLRFNNNILGKVYLKTQKIKDGLKIINFSSVTGAYDFNAHGSWIQKKEKAFSRITGELKASNVATLFNKFGSSTNISAKNLYAKFHLFWPSNIFAATLKNIQGNLILSTEQGAISNIGDKANDELATGKIITFLSLDNLQDQILTNFSDINSKGYHFENLNGTFTIEDGNAWTNNAKIQGVVASIILTGRIGFIAKDFNLFTEVIPHITSSIPIIATIAGGPIIGAATYIVNKIFSPSVNQIASSYYQLTGSWKKPKITLVRIAAATQQNQISRFDHF